VISPGDCLSWLPDFDRIAAVKAEGFSAGGHEEGKENLTQSRNVLFCLPFLPFVSFVPLCEAPFPVRLHLRGFIPFQFALFMRYRAAPIGTSQVYVP
jgi:hypothetical protein